jgi:hypothetical protein
MDTGAMDLLLCPGARWAEASRTGGWILGRWTCFCVLTPVGPKRRAPLDGYWILGNGAAFVSWRPLARSVAHVDGYWAIDLLLCPGARWPEASRTGGWILGRWICCCVWRPLGRSVAHRWMDTGAMDLLLCPGARWAEASRTGGWILGDRSAVVSWRPLARSVAHQGSFHASESTEREASALRRADAQLVGGSAGRTLLARAMALLAAGTPA